DRECVTTWIARNRSRFPAEALICPLPGLATERWVLDTADDYEFCRKVAPKFGAWPAQYLRMLDFLDDEPELRDINRHHPCNERYHEALAKEEIVPRSYARSQEIFTRAHKVIPLACQTFSKSYVQYGREAPLFVTHGSG